MSRKNIPIGFALCLLFGAIAVVPVAAAIKAMDLTETMRITDGVMAGQIVEKDVVRYDYGDVQGELYTRLVVSGEELRSGEKTTRTLYYMGGVNESGALEAPCTAPRESQTRVGAQVVAFYWNDPDLTPAGAARIFHFGNVFQVQQGSGGPAVIGMGEGTPIPHNMKLADLAARVEAVHQQIMVEKRK